MNSKDIEQFLNSLRTAREEYNMACSDETESNDETQDILHAIEWVSDNQKVIKGSELLLGSVRKIERNIESRYYVPRTDIVNKSIRRNKNG